MNISDLLSSNLKIRTEYIQIDYYYQDGQYRACASIYAKSRDKIENGLYIIDAETNQIIRNGFL